MGVELVRNFVMVSMRNCFRSILRHPILLGMVFLLILLSRLFPLLFSLLVYASPVIVSTAVLLGTLLSFGQPNIPAIEKEEMRNCDDEIHKLKTGYMRDNTEIVGRDGSSVSEEVNEGRSEIMADKSSGEKMLVETDVSADNDGRPCDDVDEPDGSVDTSASKTNEKSIQLKSEEEHVIEEAKNELGDERTDVDDEKSVSEIRHSQIHPSEDEHTEFENDDKLREGSVDPLHSAEGLWKRVDQDEDDGDEGSDSGSDLAESSSPDASMADIIPMLDELHPLLAEESEAPQPTQMSHDGSDAVSEHSFESSDSSSELDDDITNQEELEAADDEEEESYAGKEDETTSPITWTEDDQKNLMNLGTSELERNQRLENLIARRRARKNMRMLAEKNLIDLEGGDLPFNIAPISTSRNNPFDLPFDSNDNIPGSAPSVLLPRRNPFDLPYDSSEEKPDLAGDTFQQDFVAIQPKDPFFRRHESFSVGPSMFGASRQERQATRLRPYFIPERIASEGTGYSSFERQLSELSESKVSSIPDTESTGSADDHENTDHIEDDISRQADLISTKENELVSEVTEYAELVSASEHASEVRKHVSEYVSQRGQSFEDNKVVELGQVTNGNDRLDEANEKLGDVEDHQEVVSEIDNVVPSMEVVSRIQLDPVGIEKHSSGSSSSSLSEASELIFNEKEGEEVASVPERNNCFVDPGNSIATSDFSVTSLAMEESQPKEPVYDSSPPAVGKSLLSSSISMDLQVEISERGQSPPTLEKTNSLPGIESEEIVQSIEKETPAVEAVSVDSSEHDAVEISRSMRVTPHNLNDSKLSLEHSVEGDHLHQDKSFQDAKDQLQSSCSMAGVKEDPTDSNPETRHPDNQLLTETDNEEHLLEVEKLSTSPPAKPLPDIECHLMIKEASHQEEQGQVTSSTSDAGSHEVIHVGDENLGSANHKDASEEKVISRPQKELSSSDGSIDKKSTQDYGELKIQELENPFSLIINPASGPKAPPNLAQVSDIDGTGNYDVPENIEDVHEVKEIEENLLMELDAVGDFSVNELGSNFNEMKQHVHTSQRSHLEHDLNLDGSGDEDFKSTDVSDIKIRKDAEVLKKPQNEETSNAKVASASEAEVPRTSPSDDCNEVVLIPETESSILGSTTAEVDQVGKKKNSPRSSSSSSSSSSASDSDKE